MPKLASEPSGRAFPSVLPELMAQHHHRSLLTPLQEWQKSNRIPPVLLLTGQPGIGKRAICFHLAQWFLCEASSQQLTPCQVCAPCQTFLSGNAIQITDIQSEENRDEYSPSSGSLKIDQFRDLKASVAYGHSRELSKYRIIIISKAERMTPQAANSVLKLLEEPPAGWIFLLTTHDPSLLLPTLVSRCHILRLKPMSQSDIERILAEEGVESNRRKICSRLALGSLQKARDFSEDEVWEQRKVLLEFIQEPQSTVHTLIDWAAQKPHSFDILLDFLEQILDDLLTWASAFADLPPESYEWKTQDGKKELLAHIQRITRTQRNLEAARSFWLERFTRIAQARQEALTPVNRRILVQDILLPWTHLGASQ